MDIWKTHKHQACCSISFADFWMLIYIYSALAHVCLQVQLGSLINSTASFAGCFFTPKKNIERVPAILLFRNSSLWRDRQKKITKNAWSQVKSVWLPGTSLKGNESQKQQLHQSVCFLAICFLFSIFSFRFPSFKLCSWTHLLQVSRRSINFAFWSVSHSAVQLHIFRAKFKTLTSWNNGV